MEHKCPNYVYISTLYSRTTCSYARRSTVIGFRKRCFVLVHSEVCCGSVRFFEYGANSAGGERLRQEGETSRLRGETGDIILLNEIKGLSKMSLVALSYKRVCNHCTLVHAPVCVCVRHAHRTEV